MDYEPGVFHPNILDQDDIWVDIFGRAHQISYLDRDYAENILGYLLRNAVRFQRLCLQEIDGVSREALGLDPDLDDRAINWILRTPCALAIMSRILIYRDE